MESTYDIKWKLKKTRNHIYLYRDIEVKYRYTLKDYEI